MKNLILIVAYEAESHIKEVLERVGKLSLKENYEILLLDDASKDNTYNIANKEKNITGIKTTILKNPKNLGYGGNQKIGYEYAIREGFDNVVLLHGDGQYPAEQIPNILKPLEEKEADVVFGSRMLNKTDALKGGMPLYKWIGNQILTRVQNKLLGASLSEFHTGFRAYSVGLLKQIPFRFNANDFHFDADIIIQCHRANAKLAEIPIPTKYGEEICRVNGLDYAFNCIKSGTADWLTQKEIFYCRKFDLLRHPVYESKLNMDGSSHSIALSLVRKNSKVVDIGGGNGISIAPLKNKGCDITIIDNYINFDKSLTCTVEKDIKEIKNIPEGDTVLLLDIIEHITRKEQFILLEKIKKMSKTNEVDVIISVPNSVFLPVRIMHALGRINYGRRGILDETHAFLFTQHSLKELLESSEYIIKRKEYSRAPLHWVITNKFLASFLDRIQKIAIKLSPGLFSYQLIVVASPTPTIQCLLEQAEKK